MCNHSYTASYAKFPRTMGKRCPYPDLYSRAWASLSDAPELPVDDSGACLFHSRDFDWKRRNDFNGRFLLLVDLLNADTTVKEYDFAEFVFVGESRDSSEPGEGSVFRAANILFRKQAYFVGASFLDPVAFQALDFEGGAKFCDALFAGPLSLTQVRFCGLEMDRAEFSQGASFTEVDFNSYALFEDALFTSAAIGYGVLFKGSRFEGITSFRRATFTVVDDDSSVGFLQTRFDDSLDFTQTAFRCQVVFGDVRFGGTTDFVDTLFGVVGSASRYRGSSAELNDIEVAGTAILSFTSTDPSNKLLQQDFQITFKEEPLGLIQFENVDFTKILDASRKRLHRLAKLGRVVIGPGCVKYRFQTQIQALAISEGNAPLVIELCQTFTHYFTASNGFNLGFEIVDRGKTEIRFFYFTDENISEALFFDRLAKTEQSLWNLVSTHPDLHLLGSQEPASEATPTGVEDSVINAVDAISAVIRIGFCSAIRVARGTWKQADTRALLGAIGFNGDEDVDRRAESLHQTLLRNYTLVALADINARQHAGLLPMRQTPLTVLFLSSNPWDRVRLEVQTEAQEIDDRVRSADLRDAFRLEQQYEVRADQLAGKIMRFKPQILHFSGHGDKSGCLVFQDQNGLALPAQKEAIARVFSLIGTEIKCVVLNACFSVMQAEAIAEHVDVVVGMSRGFSDPDAIRFAGAFYEALAYGKDVYTAFALGKNGIDLANRPDGDVPQIRSRAGVDPRRLVLASGPL